MRTRAPVVQTGFRTSFWRRPRLGSGLLVVAGLALAGCGGDDGTTGSGPRGFTIGVTYFSLGLEGGPVTARARGDKVATLDDGRTIYEIPGEQPWFRVADQYGNVYQSSGRPGATTGGEVVDLTGVDTIRVWLLSGNSMPITDPARVASLVAAVTSGASRPDPEEADYECQAWFEAPGREPIRMFVEPSRGLVLAPVHPGRPLGVGISVGTAFDGLCPPSDSSG